ncbi:MAG: hypothetical protein N3A54_04600 [Patescibacteria group bacterium]|nr:hypothetical protein [Patescibacteria group bacterium]
MNTPVYVCKGTCNAKISQEQYDEGLTQCGADGCTDNGRPFTKMYECDECHELMDTDTQHSH